MELGMRLCSFLLEAQPKKRDDVLIQVFSHQLCLKSDWFVVRSVKYSVAVAFQLKCLCLWVLAIVIQCSHCNTCLASTGYTGTFGGLSCFHER